MTSVNTETRARPTQQTSLNLEGALHCPHDLTHNMDYRDNLPTLLDHNHNLGEAPAGLVQENPTSRLFDKMEVLILVEIWFLEHCIFIWNLRRVA